MNCQILGMKYINKGNAVEKICDIEVGSALDVLGKKPIYTTLIKKKILLRNQCLHTNINCST